MHVTIIITYPSSSAHPRPISVTNLIHKTHTRNARSAEHIHRHLHHLSAAQAPPPSSSSAAHQSPISVTHALPLPSPASAQSPSDLLSESTIAQMRLQVMQQRFKVEEERYITHRTLSTQCGFFFRLALLVLFCTVW